MDKDIIFLQRIQDEFAIRCNLTVIMTDMQGKPITVPSLESRLAKELRFSVAQAENWLRNLDVISVFDIYPGLKIIVSPIEVSGKTPYFLCVGVMVEQGSRPLLIEYLKSDPVDRSNWLADLDQLPDVSPEEWVRLMERTKIVSEIMGTLIAYDDLKEKRKQELEGIRRVAELSRNEQALSGMIQGLLDMCGDMDFAGFAHRTDDGCVISHMQGPSAYLSLIGNRITAGEGFIGLAMATGMEGTWSRLRNDPRMVIFRHSEPLPLALSCFPVQRDGEVIGVLFGGSTRLPALDPLMVEIGRITASIIRSHLIQQETFRDMADQLQRMNAVMEICKLVTKVQDLKKIAFMLVDMSMNIMQGKFAAVTLFDPQSHPDAVRIVSRGLTAEQSEQYGKILFRQYQDTDQRTGSELAPAAPQTRSMEWGEVLECPLVHQSFCGVLSVALEPGNQEAQAFLVSIAAIGSIAIHQQRQTRHDVEQRVKDLHEAIRQWSPSDYSFAQDVKSRSLSFAASIGLAKSSQQLLAYASMLVPYRPEVVSDILKQEPSICRVIRDYDLLGQLDLAENGTVEGESSYGVESQILKLVSDSLRNKEGTWHPIPVPAGIDPKLGEQFNAYLLRNRTIDQQVSADANANQASIADLSNREREVLRLIVQGHVNKQVAAALFISEHTVKNHVTNIFHKLNVTDRAGLIAYYYQHLSLPQ